LKWVAKFRKGLPLLLEEYPNHQFIFLTLTVKNCPMEQLRVTVEHMDSSFRKLVKRKLWPSLGWAKALEVTRGKDGNPHPHFHVLMMVKPSYFSGTTYINQATWTELWKGCAKLDYTPVVNVKKVKPKKGSEESGIVGAVAETLKYSVKESDLIASLDFLIGITEQLHGTRAVNLGGCFLKYIKDERETDDLVHVDEDNVDLNEKDLPSVCFGWRETSKRYALNS
jgi:plasmid rolling circle replication initiator protein Rep